MLANGVHDIFWIVAASNGEADGIGSRFFTVANGANLRAGSGTAPAAAPETGASSVTLDAPAMMPAIRAPGTVADLRPSSLAAEVNAAAADWRSIRGRRGFNMDASLHALEAAADGRPTLSGDELDRFELHLGDDASSARLRYTGYTRVGRDLRPLPIGSRLDQATGVFTWHAGPGFLRAYDLVFVRWADGRATARQEVRIVVNPRKVNRAGAQVTIDLPRANAVVSRTFVVAGWALDPDALSDTGVGALHVWAYPVSAPGNPIFLGVTAYGGRRPDVGAVFGSRFDGSGFGISVNSLPPGTYDLAVFPWSTLDSRFAPAKVVRVTVR
jgi:hypothetical protein